jgi:hypothetical protein
VISLVAENPKGSKLRPTIGMDEQQEVQAALLGNLQAVLGFVSLLDHRLDQRSGASQVQVLRETERIESNVEFAVRIGRRLVGQ